MKGGKKKTRRKRGGKNKSRKKRGGETDLTKDQCKIDFIKKLENAWSICEQFDLQTEIWRGRILRVVRDREKRGGDGRRCFRK